MLASLNPLQQWFPAPQLGLAYGHQQAYAVGSAVGSVAGIAAQIAIMSLATGGLGGLASCGSLIQKAAYAYNMISAISGMVSSAQSIASEGLGWGNGLSFVASFAAAFLPSNCFAAGTNVIVAPRNADGTYDTSAGLNGLAGSATPFSTKKIEDIQIGDEVLTRDADDPDAPLHYAKVTQLFRHVVTDLQLVTVSEVGGAGATETFEVTDEHPFYVENYGWIGAASLAVGMHVVSPDGAVLTVTANVDDQEPDGIVVYNFEVEGSHTYFVDQSLGDGVLGVWVHNTCNPTIPGRVTAGGNHLVMMSMGSKVPRGSSLLTYFGEFAHTYFHQQAQKFLSQYTKILSDGSKVSMAWGYKWGRDDIVHTFSAWERFKALRAFYRQFSFGGRSFYDEFTKEMLETLRQGRFE